MIKFTKIRYKNFFSVGNSFLEFDLDQSKKTVIAGKNGHGKSTMFSAITFGLFGKTVKNVNKPAVVNSVNRKDCVVEIEFTADGSSYLVRRGVKPAIFEIYKDDKIIDQTAVNDYQTYLETKILKTSFRTFIQTCIISVENYKPFMSLATRDRREFVEDILDIGVFSTMNILLKSRLNTTKDQLKIIDVELKSAKQKVLIMKDHLDELVKQRDDGVNNLTSKIESFEMKKRELEEDIEKKNDRLSKLQEEGKEIANLLSDFPSQTELTRLISGIQQNLGRLKKDEKFFHENDGCPTCLQKIDESHKNSITSKLQIEEESFEATLKDYIDRLSKVNEILALVKDNNDKYSELNFKISTELRGIKHYDESIFDTKQEITRLNEGFGSIEERKQELRNTASEAIEIQKKKADLNEAKTYLESAYELLKDSGIKAKIVRQYVPLINKYLNDYLERFDFFVSFNVDEEFNETIKSRHRDDFTYDSFSAGEKQRIDLACLFTMRKIAKVKNSFDCNLLMFDEILDASIDDVGTELFLDILDDKEFDKTNVFIISHKNKDKLAERFGSCIEFRKEGNFSLAEVS